MMLIIDGDGTALRNDSTIEGAPTVRVTATGVSVTNLHGGIIRSTSVTAPAILLEAAGTLVVNEVGASILAIGATDLAISGSTGADVIVNRGVLLGNISLGEGDDRFTQTVIPVRLDGQMDIGPGNEVNLGAGNDVYQFGDAAFNHTGPAIVIQRVQGGTGFDTMQLAGVIGQAVGYYTQGFERLVVGRSVNAMADFRGYSEILLEAGGNYQFLDCANPEVDLSFTGGSVAVLAESVFRSVAGSGAAEVIEVRHGSTVTGDILLGGGADLFRYSVSGSALPVLRGVVDGGADRDELIVEVEGAQTVDLSRFKGFETLNAGTLSARDLDIRITKASGFDFIMWAMATH